MAVLVDIAILADNAQVELSDDLAWDEINYPEWETGDEVARHTETTVAVATRPDYAGPVRIEVRTADDVPSDLGPPNYTCNISVTSGKARVGTLFSTSGATFEWVHALMRVEVRVDDAAAHVIFVVSNGESR